MKEFKRLLYVVDAQDDFIMQGSNLPVPEAEDIIEPTNRFFDAIKVTDFDAALFTMDTHFEDEYRRSPEADLFPLHCAYGTKGWSLVVNDRAVAAKIPTFYMSKNTFDAFGENPLCVEANIAFKTGEEKKAYANLRKVTRDPKCIDKGVDRDVFLNQVSSNTEVCVTGVASDYCVHDAILGLLKKGAKVVVLSDLVRGIGTEVDGRAPSGKIEDVVALPVFETYRKSGQICVTTSKAYVAEIQQAPKPKRLRKKASIFRA